MRRYQFLLFMILLAYLTGCTNKIPEVESSSTVAIINEESITSEMVEDKIKDRLLQVDIQQKNLERLKKTEISEITSEKVAQLEKNLAVEVTPNLAFNDLAREIVQEQEAKKRGLTVSAAEIEKMIEQSHEAEKNMDKDSEDYRIIQEGKHKLMDVKGLKTEKEYEDYLRSRMKKRFLIGHLEATVSETLAESLAIEHPELIGEKFRPALEKKYQDYLEELLANAKVDIIDPKFSIEPSK